MKRVLALFVIIGWTINLVAGEIKQGTPESVGMSSDGLERLTEAMQKKIDESVAPGIHVVVARNGTVVYDKTIGTKGVDDDTPLPKDALWRIYSMTKPITAVAAMQLWEQGKFKLSDPVTKFIPEFEELTVFSADGEHKPVTTPMDMRHVLTHTAGIGYSLSDRHPVDRMFREQRVLGSENLETMIEKMKGIPLKFQPGTRWAYSAAVDVTGLLVERISGQPFDEYLAEHIFEPLGMKDTYFEIPEDQHSRLLPNHYWNGEENKLVQIPKNENEYRNVTFFSGGGGLISTTADYLRFAEMLRAGGELDGARILDSETLDLMTQDHLPDITNPATEDGEDSERQVSAWGFGLGFGINNIATTIPNLSSAGEFNWGGAAGTTFWVDPDKNLLVIGMIQRWGGTGMLFPELKNAVLSSVEAEPKL